MDRQAVIGFILIALVLVLWIYFSPITEVSKQEKKESTKVESREERPTDQPRSGDQPGTASVPSKHVDFQEKDSSLFAPFRTGNERAVRVSTDLYDIEFSTLGGGIKRFTLKNFFTWNNRPV